MNDAEIRQQQAWTALVLIVLAGNPNLDCWRGDVATLRMGLGFIWN